MPNPIGPIRSGLTPQGRDEPRSRCCAKCSTPYNCGNEICRCHPTTGENR